MIRAHIQLTEDQVRKLRHAARARGVPIAEIVRRCIDRAIDEFSDRRDRYDRAHRLVGAYQDREGEANVAVEHDRYFDMAAEFDSRRGVRGKYAEPCLARTKVVVLDPDIAAEFRDSKAVNTALRTQLQKRPGK